MNVEPRHSVQELEKHARAQKNARIAQRIRAVILAERGRDAPTIAALLGRSRRAAQEWVRWYNQEGLDALPDAPRPGQPKKLTAKQEEALWAWLDAGPDVDRGESARRGPEIREHIEIAFGVKFSVGGAYSTLHQLGYSALKPRPGHRKSDPAAQAQFMKDAPLLSRRSGENASARSSRSGSWMKPGSAGKAR